MYIEKLPKNVSRRLFIAGVKTDEALAQMTYEELLKIRNIGHGAIEIINQAVRIPMGFEPLVRPEPKEINPNLRAGLDRYWAAYHEGKAYNGLHGYKKVEKVEEG